MSELILKDEVYAVVGAAIDVHRELGPGFLESIYQEAMEIELKTKSIPFVAQQPITVRYKGATLKKNTSLIWFALSKSSLKSRRSIIYPGLSSPNFSTISK